MKTNPAMSALRHHVTWAIARSISHNEIATVVVADKDEAYSALGEAKAAAKAAGHHFGGTDSNEGLECWACPMDSDRDDEMVWRLDIRIG